MTFIAYVYWKLQTAKKMVRQIAEKSLFRRLFQKRHGKRCQKLLKCEGQPLTILINQCALESKDVSLIDTQSPNTVC